MQAKKLPAGFPAAICVPFFSQESACGIFLGRRCSGVRFRPDEFPLLTLIASQMAQRLITTLTIQDLSEKIRDLSERSLNSSRRNRGLQGLTKGLFRNIEQERKMIASDIHDGVLQLGLDLSRYLRYLIPRCPTDEKTAEDIAHMLEAVDQLNFELRSMCNDLRPAVLGGLGLCDAVEFLCEETMRNESVLISFQRRPTVGFSSRQNRNGEKRNEA